MRADTQLDYGIFQLTPTRTRCELHIVAKGVTYKLASGLLNPFVSHLKAAEEQLAKGGYSLRLEPPDPSKASWFTKGTMERFVRFVSTPEVLERVSSVEVELLELEETTRQQSAEINEAAGSEQVDNPLKTATSQSFPGGKLAGTAALDKVTKGLSDGVEIRSEENSKQRLLRALDARRIMLQKEQGMAFARALAAGFNLEIMDDLVLFAECFGADRLCEACIKFVALCKKRQEAGLGLEDLELMAADTAQADVLYMGAVGGNAMGLVWPHLQANVHDLPHPPEGNQAVGQDCAEKACEEVSQTMPASRDGDFSPTVVKGHPMMSAWQGQPPNQFMAGVPPYAAMHPGTMNNFDPSFGFTGSVRPGQMGLAYPHYMGGPYMPSPYADGNGWQSVSPVPPHFWPGNHVNDPIDGNYHWSSHQSATTPPPRDKEMQESSRLDSGDMQDNEGDSASENGLPGRAARRSTSRRRRSVSPRKKVQRGHSGGSKRSGMVVIRNINYIAPKGKHQDNQGDGSSENSDGWSDDSDEKDSFENGTDILRSSEDAVEAVEGKHHLSHDGKTKHAKKKNKKATSKYSGHHRGDNGDDAELDDEELQKHKNEQKEYVWVINRRDSEADENSKVFPEEGLLSSSGSRNQGSFDPASEGVCAEKRGPVDVEVRSLSEDAALLSQSNGNKAGESQLFDMFKQEQQGESKKMATVDDSYILLGGESSAIEKSNTRLELDHELNIKQGVDPQAGNALPDDSFILLDRSAGREAPKEDWSVSLNLEAEMPLDQGHESAVEPNNFEPDDLFMVPDRDQDLHMGAWNSPLDYNMQVLTADFMDTGRQCEDVAKDEDDPETQQQEVEDKRAELIPRKLSDKDMKAKVTKEMLERRKLNAGPRTGRPNPLADAQLRAEKLRVYKAGLQKSKQEREEEERKRIEDLRIQRQQRIAARSNSGGSSQVAISSVRGARTPPPTANKSSPKVPNKGSPLLSSVSWERLTNGSRAARNMSDCPKPTESSAARSLSSLAELRRESKRPSSVVRASTGLHVLTSVAKMDRHVELNAHGKSNGRAEGKPVLAKIGCSDDKIGRSNSGVAEERVGRSESGRIDEKIGQTESGRTDGLSESGRMSEKALPIATRATKRFPAAQDAPASQLKSPRSPTIDSIVGKKGLTVHPERVGGLASQVKSPKSPTVGSKILNKTLTTPVKSTMQNKTNFAPKATIVEKLHTESARLPSPLKGDPKVGKSENIVKLLDGKGSSPSEAENSLLDGNGNKYASDSSMAALMDNLSIVKTNHENGLSLQSPLIMSAKESKEGASQSVSSLEAGIVMSDVRQPGIQASCPVVGDYDTFGDHVSPSNYNKGALAEMDILAYEEDLAVDNSPPFAPPSEHTTSLSVDHPLFSMTSQQELIIESSSNDVRSRKKWGDSKARGLKRLLLLGRKNGRSSSHNAADVPSEGEEDESHRSNGKNTNKKVNDDLGTCTSQAAGSGLAQEEFGSSNSLSKGSRSIFSLSSFRGNKSYVKA